MDGEKTVTKLVRDREEKKKMKFIILGILNISIILLGNGVKNINWKNSKEANQQALIQFFIYTLSFIILVFTHFAAGEYSVLFFLFWGCNTLYTLYQLCVRAKEQNAIPVIMDTAKPLLKIVAFTWYGIFSSFCCINYMLVVSFPQYYSGYEGMSFALRAFNVVYYSFSIMLTYSANGIFATGVLSQSAEMIEILCSYVIIGIVIANSIGKAVEKT